MTFADDLLSPAAGPNVEFLLTPPFVSSRSPDMMESQDFSSLFGADGLGAPYPFGPDVSGEDPPLDLDSNLFGFPESGSQVFNQGSAKFDSVAESFDVFAQSAFFGLDICSFDLGPASPSTYLSSDCSSSDAGSDFAPHTFARDTFCLPETEFNSSYRSPFEIPQGEALLSPSQSLRSNSTTEDRSDKDRSYFKVDLDFPWEVYVKNPERREKILEWKKKKLGVLKNDKVRKNTYQVRKDVADRRLRVKGRFVGKCIR